MDGGDDLESNTYGNTSDIRPRSQSEPIPVEKLEWYNRTNVSLIKKQYEVSTTCQSGLLDVVVCCFCCAFCPLINRPQ